MIARGSMRVGFLLSSAKYIGAYQPSKVTSTERSAVTTAANMAIERRGAEAAAVATGGAVDVATCALTKQPTTRTSSMTPTARLVKPASERPMRRPIQCSPVKAARIETATSCGWVVAAGQSAPRKDAAVMDAYASGAGLQSQSLHPTTTPAPSPKACRAKTRNPPASGNIVASSATAKAPKSE